MKLTIPATSRAPLIPLGAAFIVGYLNIVNRCADGWCYTYGWPLTAYYRWSNSVMSNFDGIVSYSRMEWLPTVGNLVVAAIILTFVIAAH